MNFKRFIEDEEGMGTIEVAVIVIVLVGLAFAFKGSIGKLLEKITGKYNDGAINELKIK